MDFNHLTGWDGMTSVLTCAPLTLTYNPQEFGFFALNCTITILPKRNANYSVIV